MTESSNNGIFARLGRGITRFRNFTLNAIFLALMLALVLALLADDIPAVPEDSALLVNPRGVLVEQRSFVDPFTQFLAPNSPKEIELSEITDALTLAAADDRIHLAVLDLDEFSGLGAGQAEVIGDAIRDFQAAGKQVVVHGSGFGQSQYLLASFADALYMHPMGQLILSGYGGNQIYFKGLLDKLHVNLHIFRAGRYKEFVEPYIRTDMSDEARTANQALVDELWSQYSGRVIENRNLDPEVFARYTQSLPDQLVRMGDLASTALEHHLIDELLSPDEARARVANEVGYAADGNFLHIGYDDYLRAAREREYSGPAAVGVITAEGPIVMGRQNQGVIAADTVMELIRQARQDDDIRALVLRVNSPGGSAFASEMIRQELELFQLSGKPVVVSMSNVAASGGYWISATADAIYARPTTVTGSIGVFGIVPTFEKALSNIGVTTDGVGTTPLSRAFDPFAGISEDMSRILQLNTEHTYEQFLNLVARGRDMDPAAVDEVAQGRVWTGARAQALGLVDEMGGLQEAIAHAAQLAEIEDYGVQRLRPQPTPRELLLSSLGGIRSRWLPFDGSRIGAVFAEAERFMAQLNDPNSSYAICEPCYGPGGLHR